MGYSPEHVERCIGQEHVKYSGTFSSSDKIPNPRSFANLDLLHKLAHSKCEQYSSCNDIYRSELLRPISTSDIYHMYEANLR
jgi:hypothetical protein